MSMGNTLVNGTGHVIANGRDMVNGTVYAVKTGKTLVNGAGYQIGSNGTPIGDLAVESIVNMNVNGSARSFIIVHQGRPSSLYDESCNGTWLMMEDIYEKHRWSTSGDTKNNYKASAIHSYLNSTFLGLLDKDIQSAIKQVKIPYVNGMGGSAVASGVNGISAKIFPLSGYEVGWNRSTNYYFPIDGACLSYFNGTAPADTKRVGKLDGTAVDWWLRSPYNSGDSYVWSVESNGDYGYSHHTASYGVRPALVLPSEALVDENNNVLG